MRSRTALFKEKVSGPEDLRFFSSEIKRRESQEKLYEVIYCCEYLGFIDAGEKKVGCLLHPLQNGGADLRDASFYGKELCEGHFCPSYHYLTREEKKGLVNCIDDWYLYGLCVTDIDLVKEYFRFISQAIYQAPCAERFKEDELKKIALEFFSLKIFWPFRSQETNRFGKYYFDGSQYMISHIDYQCLGCERSRFDKIFLSLASCFHSKEELIEAERIIQSTIDRFVDHYRNF
ncbi:MAG: hypothetical protein M0P57_06245 [Syntrophales bacterium]|nr:hypothetical protein [Syntrophales bacterium]MDY0043633.1 hypothetical protein [Syntrophales bacterium]